MNQNKYFTYIDIISLLFILTLYTFSFNILNKSLSNIFFYIMLIFPIYLFNKNFPENNYHNEKLDKKTSFILIIYSFTYIISIYKYNILGASISYWLVQFIIPAIILYICNFSLNSVNFNWSSIFKNFKIVLISCLFMSPFLLYGVRDSEKIIHMITSYTFYLYLPISILYMTFVVAFWEEFFFRGIILSSLKTYTNNWVLPVIISSLLFSTYHIPMRFFNVKSEFYNNFYKSIAGTINEQLIIGLFLGYIVYKSKNVWTGIWIHAFFNGFSFVYKITQIIKFG